MKFHYKRLIELSMSSAIIANPCDGELQPSMGCANNVVFDNSTPGRIEVRSTGFF